jgi:dimethylglycine catabolism B
VPLRIDTALTALRETDNAEGADPRERTSWTAGLGIRHLRPGEEVDILLWQGEGAFQSQGRRTLRALAEVLTAARSSFAILGEDEIDCGDLARRVGDEALFAATAVRVVALLARYRFRRIVTADPHVLHSLRNEYAAFGGQWPVQHHSELLAELVASGLPLQPRRRQVTYHDPCYLARYNRQTSAPRAVLSALGFELREMERHGAAARCCGGGGGAPLADIPGRTRIPDQRMADASATGAAIVAVACPGCAGMLSGVSGLPIDVKDIAELTAEALASRKDPVT